MKKLSFANKTNCLKVLLNMIRVKNFLKHILYKFPHSTINNFYSIYNFFRYYNLREKRISCGYLNSNKTFYLIRPRVDKVEGLMSLLLNVSKQINFAINHNYLPVVDFENYKTQYYDKNIVLTNVWEYYFLQPSNYTLDSVYNSKNVILSGLSALSKCEKFIDMSFDSNDISKAHLFLNKYIHINNTVQDKLQKYSSLFNPKYTLGLYLRGTDYIALKPAGHYIQPSIDEAINMAEYTIKKYGLKQVLLVTEDGNIYKRVENYFKDMLVHLPFDRLITNYSSKSYLSKDDSINQVSESPYERGMIYLIKVLLLSSCQYFIGGKTCGSWASCTFSQGFKYFYLFDLGKY